MATVLRQPEGRKLQRIVRSVLLCGFCILVAAAGLPASAEEPSTATPRVREFQVKGVVKRVERESSTAIIEHEAIPGYMEAMTMPFRARKPEVLRDLTEGDAISFRLFVTEEESWIDEVAKIEGPKLERMKSAGPGASAPKVVVNPSHHPLLDYAFTNELGEAVRLADFRGQALAITFIFTRCPIPDYCPRLSKNFEEALLKLKATPGAPTNWHFLSVSFDTEFDTPAVLKAYGERFGYDPQRWSFLTGPADKIAELARLSDMKFEATNGFFSHNLRTLIIDPSGTLRMNIPVGGNLSETIASELLAAATAVVHPTGTPERVAQGYTAR